MSNRVYRTAAYYGDTSLDAFHYNAYNNGSITMSTYVHDSATTAVDFTCLHDLPAATETVGGIFYPPMDDNASRFNDFVVKEDTGITQNLLVYTADNDEATGNEAYDVVEKASQLQRDYKRGFDKRTPYNKRHRRLQHLSVTPRGAHSRQRERRWRDLQQQQSLRAHRLQRQRPRMVCAQTNVLCRGQQRRMGRHLPAVHRRQGRRIAQRRDNAFLRLAVGRGNRQPKSEHPLATP